MRADIALQFYWAGLAYAFQGQGTATGSDAHDYPEVDDMELRGPSLRIAALLFGNFTGFLAFTHPYASLNSAWTLLALCHSRTQVYLSLSACRDYWGDTIPTLHLH